MPRPLQGGTSPVFKLHLHRRTDVEPADADIGVILGIFDLDGKPMQNLARFMALTRVPGHCHVSGQHPKRATAVILE